MLTLQNKVAVVFAANGAIAGVVARSFSQHGATVYLSGRNETALKQLAEEITAGGGKAFPFVVDATDEASIDTHLAMVVSKEGKLDIVFNGIGIPVADGKYGTPTTVLPFEVFMKPLQVHLGSQFLTSRVAARYMMQTHSKGTILTLSASLSRMKMPFMAGITAACTGIEGLTRVMAAEFGQAGIKVICLNPTGIAETRTIQETTMANAKTLNIPPQVMGETISRSQLLQKGPVLKDIGEAAVLLASDAGAIFNSHILDADFGVMNVI